MSIVKFAGSWFCIVGAIVLIVLSHQPFGLAGMLAILAIAFATAPANW